MNTFGLKRGSHSFGLGTLKLSVVEAYHEIQKFVLTVAIRYNLSALL